ncbi:MAG: helix-turn-helix domain-containing protein, partial [Lactococcus sp.]|nr:helix-turn-helix domain-containing protein [Lactococcus sp.]
RPVSCTIGFRRRFIHFEIIMLKKPSKLGLCNKATTSYKLRVHSRITESLLEFKRASLEAYISQEQLTLLTAIDRSYLWRIESGEVNITVENSIKYLKC